MPDNVKAPTAERIVQAARDLFYSHGYEVSVDRIVERAAVAKPTVYAHFASKEALIEAVLVAGRAEFFDQLDAVPGQPGTDLADRLLAPFDVLVAGLPDATYRGCLCVNAAAAFPAPDHPAHQVLREMEARLLAIWAGLAADAGARQPDLLARQLLLLFDGVKVMGLTDHSGASAADARAAARTLLRHASSPEEE